MMNSALKINVNGLALNTQERRDKATLVAQEMFFVVNHPSFKKRFLAMDFHGERSEWKDRTIEEIWDHFCEGAEILTPEKDGEVDLYVDDYYSPGSTVGKTSPTDKFIYCNTKFFDSNSTKYVGSNFFHEWGHKIGFDHDFRATAARDFSICYQINEIYEAVWEEIYGRPQADLVQVCYRAWPYFWRVRCEWRPATTHAFA